MFEAFFAYNVHSSVKNLYFCAEYATFSEKL
jgi:hypothetical protein